MTRAFDSLNQWVPGSSPGGCILKNLFRVKGFGAFGASLLRLAHASTRLTFASGLSKGSGLSATYPTANKVLVLSQVAAGISGE
jgi:hypothetical protein